MTAADARDLWTIIDVRPWTAALRAYPSVVAAQQIAELGDLDRWYTDELPTLLAERDEPYIDREELTRIVKWKMMRGEWHQRNLLLVRSNRDADIRAASQEAFALAPEPRAPLTRLAKLDGVGPATASAVLGACRGDLYPFLDELVGAAIAELGEPKFTAPYYVRYAEALRNRAADLGGDWTAQRVGLALWAASGGKAAL